ncbi:transposase, partial [Priestia megaterium]|uniref:transposase n=1 Tax=Priestia megaterium TaxID=1404 RepID=UPI002E1BB4B4
MLFLRSSITGVGTTYTKVNFSIQRNLDTQYGRIEGLLVPRDRNGEFQTQLFAPYQRHTGWLEEAIIR